MLLSFFVFGAIISALAMSNPISTREISSRTIYQFPKIPTWIENIRPRQNGQLLVTLLTSPDIYLIETSPTTNPTAALLHSFPKLALLGITEVKQDIFYVAAGNYSLAAGLTNGSFSIYSLDLTSYDCVSNSGAISKEIAAFPESRVFNGMDTLDVEKGLILIGDSMAGVIWLLNVYTGEKGVFLSESEMAPPPPPSSQTGVNGIKISKTMGDLVWIYFSNTQKKTFCRVSVSLETLEKVGSVEILNEGTSFDDFALDEQNGVAYLAAGTKNELVSVPLEGGEPSVVLKGLFGVTSAALGKEELYAVTSGLNGTSGFVESGSVVGIHVL